MLTEGFLFLGSANFCRKGTNVEEGSVAFSGCREKRNGKKKATEQNHLISQLILLYSYFVSTYWTVINEDK